jgi:hypothetical protein
MQSRLYTKPSIKGLSEIGTAALPYSGVHVAGVMSNGDGFVNGEA